MEPLHGVRHGVDDKGATSVDRGSHGGYGPGGRGRYGGRKVEQHGSQAPLLSRFDGRTSWEQYKQVFDAIVSSNGWDNDTAALQLFSHLEGMH